MYDCDETALYWRIEPDKTLASGPVQGKKKSKDRASILITCNSTGDDKLPVLFIYKYQIPVLFGILIKKNYQSTIFGIAAHGCKCQSLISIYENLIVKCNKPIELFFYSWITLPRILLKKASFLRTLKYIISLQIQLPIYNLAMRV